MGGCGAVSFWQLAVVCEGQLGVVLGGGPHSGLPRCAHDVGAGAVTSSCSSGWCEGSANGGRDVGRLGTGCGFRMWEWH